MADDLIARRKRSAEAAARYAKRHPDRIKANTRKQTESGNAARAKALWRARKPELSREIDRRSNQKHSKKRAAEAAEWRTKNQEHVRQYQREYDAKRHNRDERNAEKRATYAANREAACAAAREWRRSNPEIKRVYKLRYRARKRGATGSHTAAQLQELLERQMFLCANPYCRADLRGVTHHPDHIISLSRGGSNGIENLQWLCRPCNSRKSDLDPADWLRREACRGVTHNEKAAAQ